MLIASRVLLGAAEGPATERQDIWTVAIGRYEPLLDDTLAGLPGRGVLVCLPRRPARAGRPGHRPDRGSSLARPAG